MSKTTIPNGLPNSGFASLETVLSTFDKDARFAEMQSEKVSGDPRILENFLFMFYDQDNVTASLRQEIYQIERQNELLRADIDQQQEELDGLRDSVQHFLDDRDRLTEEKQNEIAGRKVEIRRIKGGDYALLETHEHPANRLAFWIATVILFLLTGYLISFYASVIYNSFLLDPLVIATRQAEESMVSTVTITNIRAFPMVYEEHGILGVLFLLTGTFVFITLGFLLYWFSRSRRSVWQYVLYIFTFLFDAFLAYEIVRKIHLSQSILSDMPPWKFSMAFSQMEFYIILCAGFGIYIAWGLLLRYVLEEYHKILPALAGIRRRKAEIARLDQDIKEIRQKFGEKINLLQEKIRESEQRKVAFFRHSIEQNEGKIAVLREKLRTHLQNSGTKAQNLRVHVTSFLAGWCKSIHDHQKPEDKADRIVKECHDVVNKFYRVIGLN